MHCTPHLKLALWGEDADPAIVVVRNDDIPIEVHSDTCGTLQLPRGAAADTESQAELAFIGENLPQKTTKAISG